MLLNIKESGRFHGHIGPWLILGWRCGRYGAQKLMGSPFEILVLVECPAKPPASCFIDGIQTGSGCTMGKGNINHRRRNGVCRAFFQHLGNGRRLLIQVRPELIPGLHLIPPEKVKRSPLQSFVAIQKIGAGW